MAERLCTRTTLPPSTSRKSYSTPFAHTPHPKIRIAVGTFAYMGTYPDLTHYSYLPLVVKSQS